ncbi:MAG: hypothetical protein WKG07_30380 [Hymenobacter sp.]
MKKTFLTLAASVALTVAVGLATPALAQNSAVTNALLSQKAGQFDKAIVSINEAIVNDKTKDKAKTWFTRGEIYNQLAGPQHPGTFCQVHQGHAAGGSLAKSG